MMQRFIENVGTQNRPIFCNTLIVNSYDPQFQQKQAKRIQNTQQQIKYEQDKPQQNIVFQSQLFSKELFGFSWKKHPNALLTNTYLLDHKIYNISKIKITSQSVNKNSKFLKITINDDQNYVFGCLNSDQIGWFSSIIWAKLNSFGAKSDLNQAVNKNGQVKGQIMRKSKYLGNWDFRRVVIDNSYGLRSYKPDQGSPTTSITRISQLWTRFELMNGSGYLVIKCKSDDGKKCEYAIPLKHLMIWIKGFYSLMV